MLKKLFRPSRRRLSVVGLVLLVVLGTALFGLAPLASAAAANLGYLELARLAVTAEPVVVAARYDPPPIAPAEPARRAEAAFRRAVEWAPNSGVARAGLGEVLIRQGRYAEATENLDRAVRLDGPGRFGYAAGNAHLYAGDRPGALAHWRAAAADPADRLVLATTLFGQSSWDNYHPDRWDDAIGILESTLAEPHLTATDQVLLAERLGYLYEQRSDGPHAEQALRRVLALDPRRTSAWISLGWVALRAGDDEAALAAAQAALAIEPNWPAHYVRGDIFLRRCQVPEAIAEFQTGLTFPADEYRHDYLRGGLAAAEWEAGQAAPAIADWQAYRKTQPGDADAARKLAQAQNGTLPRQCHAN